VLARILFGYRTSLVACTVAVGIALLLGGTIGLLSAYFRGWFERVAMRLMDVLFAFPVLLLAIGIIAVLGPHTASAAVAIAVVYTPIFARLLRGPALVICESEYVAGARAIGASDGRILVRHVLPNLASVILVQTSLLLSARCWSRPRCRSGPRHPAADALARAHALGGAQLPAALALERALRGVCDPLPLLRLQPPGRRAARLARSAPERAG
jgi:ABC-type antimicrobial peptide transport system permease subunit